MINQRLFLCVFFLLSFFFLFSPMGGHCQGFWRSCDKRKNFADIPQTLLLLLSCSLTLCFLFTANWMNASSSAMRLSSSAALTLGLDFNSNDKVSRYSSPSLISFFLLTHVINDSDKRQQRVTEKFSNKLWCNWGPEKWSKALTANRGEKLLTPWLFTLSPAFRLIVERLWTDIVPLPDTAFVCAPDAILDGNLW